jgi:four helix bundle protein
MPALSITCRDAASALAVILLRALSSFPPLVRKELKMSLQNFKTYQLAVQFHHECERLRCPNYLRDQLLRASSSIALNLAEGSAKPTLKDRRKFYAIAFGSLRECQAVLDLAAPTAAGQTSRLADALGACLYRLTHPCARESL